MMGIVTTVTMHTNLHVKSPTAPHFFFFLLQTSTVLVVTLVALAIRVLLVLGLRGFILAPFLGRRDAAGGEVQESCVLVVIEMGEEGVEPAGKTS